MSESILTVFLSSVLSITAMTTGILAVKQFGVDKTAPVIAVKTSEASAVPVALPYVSVHTSVSGFGVTNQMFMKSENSTKLYGTFVNYSNRDWNELVFEVEAVNKQNNRIQGDEDKFIFSVTQLKRGQSISINDGYGVWLSGIATEDISHINLRLVCANASKGESRFLSCKDSDKSQKSLEYYREIDE